MRNCRSRILKRRIVIYPALTKARDYAHTAQGACQVGVTCNRVSKHVVRVDTQPNLFLSLASCGGGRGRTNRSSVPKTTEIAGNGKEVNGSTRVNLMKDRFIITVTCWKAKSRERKQEKNMSFCSGMMKMATK